MLVYVFLLKIYVYFLPGYLSGFQKTFYKVHVNERVQLGELVGARPEKINDLTG